MRQEKDGSWGSQVRRHYCELIGVILAPPVPRKRAKRNEATGLPMATTPSAKWYQNEQKSTDLYKELCANQTQVDVS